MLDHSFDDLLHLDLSWHSFLDYILNDDWSLYSNINILIDWNFDRNLDLFLDDFLNVDFSLYLSRGIILYDSSLGNFDDFGNIDSNLFLYDDILIEWLLYDFILVNVVDNCVKNNGSFLSV